MLQSTVLLNEVLEDYFRANLYVGTVELNQPLAVSDVLEYRVIAVDNSAQNNRRTAPVEGLYTIPIEETFAATITYINDFNLPSADFTGTDFTVEAPSEFNDAAIQSPHPYISAGDGNILNFTYQLNIPIQIRTREPLIEFDEIVLVEPGEPNTVYTDAEFWDYVIVEGRKIDGVEWLPIIAGYDSSDDPEWSSAFQNGRRFNNESSRTIGTPDLIKSRSIDMTQSGHFKSGDTVFIRFRLFSDPSLTGWGWAIDNLRIQDSSVAVEDFISTSNFQLFPNPVTNKVITINAFLKQPVSDLQLILYNDSGQLILQQEIASNQGEIQEIIDVADFPSGLYFVTIQMDGTKVMGKKVVVH